MVQRESQGINSTFDFLNQHFLGLLESGWDLILQCLSVQLQVMARSIKSA